MNQAVNWVAFLTLWGIGFMWLPSLFHSMPFSSSAPLLSSYSLGAAKLGIPVPYHKKIKENWDRMEVDEKMAALDQQLTGGKVGQVLNAPGKFLKKAEGPLKAGVAQANGAVSNLAAAAKATGAIPKAPATTNPSPPTLPVPNTPGP